MLRASAVTTVIPGTSTNDNAQAGYLGEIIKANLLNASAIALTTNTPANVIVGGISLTAGDWDIYSTCQFIPAASTSYTQLILAISLTSATLSTQAGGSGLDTDPLLQFDTAAQVPVGNITMDVGPVRLSIAATTSVFMVAQATFTVAGMSAAGTMRARRVR
jgi:hypothetical protein